MDHHFFNEKIHMKLRARIIHHPKKSFCIQMHVYGFSVMPGILLWIFNNYLLMKKAAG